jgi:hypothetical protein
MAEPAAGCLLRHSLHRRAGESSRLPKLTAVALQIIAAPQQATIAPRVQMRRTRSARTQKGSVLTAATSDVTVTSRASTRTTQARAAPSAAVLVKPAAVARLGTSRQHQPAGGYDVGPPDLRLDSMCHSARLVV